MPATTTDITDWTGAQPGDVVLYDGSLVLVDRINIVPEEGHPDFLIAHVTGRHLDDDGTLGRMTGMSPNARSLIAVRRISPDLAVQLAAAIERAEKLQRACHTLGWVVEGMARSLRAAWIDIRQGDLNGAAQWVLESVPDVDDNEPELQWNGTESSHAWFERTRPEPLLARHTAPAVPVEGRPSRDALELAIWRVFPFPKVDAGPKHREAVTNALRAVDDYVQAHIANPSK